MEESKVVGPITIAYRRRAGVKLHGRRRRKVIIDVGRSITATEARISEADK